MCPTAQPSAPEHPATLLQRLGGRRLVVVTGKGGTGKSTVATALGLAAARAGLRTLLVETGGAQGLTRVLPVRESLFLLSMNAQDALEDFAIRQIKLRSLYRLVFRNRFMGPFMDTVPGLPDIIQLGKIWDLLQETSQGNPHWDLLILDAPATGHGLTMLGAPRSMMEVTRSGPFHANAQRVHDLVSNPEQTAIVLTTLPEPLPVNEALQLYEGLGSSQGQVVGCVINQMHELPFTPLEAWPEARRALEASEDPAWREAVELCGHWVAAARRQVQASTRLREALSVPIVELPYRFPRQLGLEDLEALADHFGALDREAP
jgi:anion-transporting  ArsA/GET3 family ATPase